ncbi:MAG: hypothetical protein K6B17_06945 [Treponema sp.]|nr:hypothetical protein [Treponema sp.]
MKSAFKTILSAGILAVISVSSASAFYVSDVVEEGYRPLMRDGKVEKIDDSSKSTLSLTPATDLSKKIADYNSLKGDPTLIKEKLMLVSKDELTVEKASEILRSISKMEGLTYYSHTAKKRKVLYKKAYCVNGPDSTKKVADKTEGSAENLVQYCMLDDNSLGKINYELNYHQNEKEVAVTFKNTTDVEFAFVTAVEDENINIGVSVTECENGYLVYMYIRAKYKKISVIEGRIKDSLEARLDAVYDWFMSQI